MNIHILGELDTATPCQKRRSAASIWKCEKTEFSWNVPFEIYIFLIEYEM